MMRLIPICLALCLLLWIPPVCQALTNEAAEGMVFRNPPNGLVWTKNGNLAGTELSWAEAQKFVADLNQKDYAGADNWRLPSRSELEPLFSLISLSGVTEGPTNVQSDFYWSATISPFEPDFALAVNLEDGSADDQDKNELNYVWPVH